APAGPPRQLPGDLRPEPRAVRARSPRPPEVSRPLARPPPRRRIVWGRVVTAPHGILRGRRKPPPMRLMAIRLLTAAAIVLVAAPGWAGAPTDTVKEYTDAVVKVLEDQSLKVTDRRAAVRKLANDAFDIQETARRALGPHWQQRTPAEREEFVGLFADLLERSYIAKIDLYGGERVKFIDEKIDGD